MNKMFLTLLLFLAPFTMATAQTIDGQAGRTGNNKSPATEKNIAPQDSSNEQGPSSVLTKREQELLDRIENLERRLADLEARDGVIPTSQPAPTPPMPDMPGMPGMSAKRDRPSTPEE